MREASGSLLKKALDRDRAALAKILSKVENDPTEAYRIVKACYPRTGHAWKVGVTGPPGTGKSTLIGQLANQLISSGNTVGVLAVDPTSHLTHGAILGDRIRMAELADKSSGFVRSMATRGQAGGISRAAFDAMILLDAAGYDYVITETIGAGQADITISRCTHTVILVTAPNLGDEIQALKAGLMEIADVYVLNKSDLPGVQGALNELRQAISASVSGWKPIVVRTIATQGQGVEEILNAIQQHRKFITGSTLPRDPTFFAVQELKQASSNLIELSFSDRAASEQVATLANKIAKRKVDPYSAAKKLIATIRRP